MLVVLLELVKLLAMAMAKQVKLELVLDWLVEQAIMGELPQQEGQE